MKILIHTGWHKTGSTALQHFLHHNKELLLKHGICYPDTGLIEKAHHLFAWSLQEPIHSAWAKKIKYKKRAEDIFPNIINEAKNLNCHTIVLSSEEFSMPDNFKLERLKNLLNGYDYKFISYVRRQDKYIESLYNQMVKMSFVRLDQPIYTFVNHKTNSDELNYYKEYIKWANVFGIDNLIIKPYERSFFELRDIRRDFCKIICDDNIDGFKNPSHIANESLSFHSVSFLARLNSLTLNEGQHYKIAQALKIVDITKSYDYTYILNFSQRLNILNHYKESNEKFEREFLKMPGIFQISLEELYQLTNYNTNFTDDMFNTVLNEVFSVLLDKIPMNEIDILK